MKAKAKVAKAGKAQSTALKNLAQLVKANKGKAWLPPNITLQPTAYEEEHFWGVRTIIPITEDTPVVVACCNTHRETCLRVSVGRKWTHYIQMDANGLMMSRTLNAAFRKDWIELVEFTPQQVAVRYLSSRAAAQYILAEARSLLTEIATSGTLSKLDKEHDIMKTTKAANSKQPAAKAKGSKTPPEAAKAAAAPTKAASKAKKPAAQRYAGMKIKALFKPEEVGAREGSWTHFMILAALKAANAEAAQKKVDDSKEFVGKKVDMGWLISKGYISVS